MCEERVLTRYKSDKYGLTCWCNSSSMCAFSSSSCAFSSCTCLTCWCKYWSASRFISRVITIIDILSDYWWHQLWWYLSHPLHTCSTTAGSQWLVQRWMHAHCTSSYATFGHVSNCPNIDRIVRWFTNEFVIFILKRFLWHSEKIEEQAVQGILCTETWLQLATADTDSTVLVVLQNSVQIFIVVDNQFQQNNDHVN